MVAFHAQQAIEKSLKAVIEEFDLGFIKTHQLERLFEIVKEHMEANIDHKIVQMLDSLYIESRYPVDIGLLPNGKPTKKDAKFFFEFAILIYNSVKRELGGTT
jgi:HEPN domain-containing protein